MRQPRGSRRSGRLSAGLAAVDLDAMTDAELAEDLRRRASLNEQWTSVYWSDFIPFAHGVRLFGEVYNDLVEPDDPFEFVTLLTGQTMTAGPTPRDRWRPMPGRRFSITLPPHSYRVYRGQ